MHVKGVGDVGPLKNVYWCPDSSENLVGVNDLKDMGYTVILDDFCTIVDRDTDVMVVQTASINGIYLIYLNQPILLQKFKLEQDLKMNSAVEEPSHIDYKTFLEPLKQLPASQGCVILVLEPGGFPTTRKLLFRI